MKRIILLVLILALAFCIAYLYKGEIVESQLKGPTQPILFSHKIHAGVNQIPCQYCHSYVSKAAIPGMPSVQKCMGCHSQIAGKDELYKDGDVSINFNTQISTLKEYWNKKIPIPWVKVYYVAEHAHFKHQPHIRRGIQCTTCHGEVQNMHVVKRANKIEMGWCISCHQQNARDAHELTRLKDCLTCHY